MSIVLQGSTSGSITLQEPAVAGSTVLTLPAVTGTILTTTSPKAGNVIQVVSTTSSTVVTSTGTSTSVLSASITPASSSNKILILTSLTAKINANTNAIGGTQIYRGTTSGTMLQSLVSGNLSTPSCYGSFSHTFLDSPSTTSSQTYTLAINRGSGNTTSVVTEDVYSLILMEIAA